MSSPKFKVGDKGCWIHYDEGYRFEIKEVSVNEYIYDIYKDGVLVTKTHSHPIDKVEKAMRKLTKLELALK